MLHFRSAVWQTRPMATHTTARARAREAVIDEIKAEARRQLAEAGAAGLSLRAVARELGMVSSAIYRYFPSRDDLLTALIVGSYRDLATAAERAIARSDGSPRGVWRAACGAIRTWAKRHPHEYALLYGSPVPGYAAPAGHDRPGDRGLRLAGRGAPPVGPPVGQPAEAAARGLEADAARVAAALGPRRSSRTAPCGCSGPGPTLFGLVSFEVFGHTHGVHRGPRRLLRRPGRGHGGRPRALSRPQSPVGRACSA